MKPPILRSWDLNAEHCPARPGQPVPGQRSGARAGGPGGAPVLRRIGRQRRAAHGGGQRPARRCDRLRRLGYPRQEGAVNGRLATLLGALGSGRKRHGTGVARHRRGRRDRVRTHRASTTPTAQTTAPPPWRCSPAAPQGRTHRRRLARPQGGRPLREARPQADNRPETSRDVQGVLCDHLRVPEPALATTVFPDSAGATAAGVGDDDLTAEA
jgi:hypothetical protein